MTNTDLYEENETLKKRIELAFLSYNAGIYEWNMLDDSAYYSDEWKKMLGYENDDLASHVSTWSNLVHPDDIETIMQNVQETIIKQEPFIETVHRVKHKNGKWIWILGRGNIEYREDGTPIKMVGIHTDVTNRKEQELKLKHLAQMVEQTHDSVISTDLEGNIVTWNRGSELLFGYTEEEVLHQNISLLEYKDEAIDFESIAEYLIVHNELDKETKFKTKDGELIYINLSLSTYRDVNNEIVGIIGYSQDITKRKLAEENLAQHNHNLEQYLQSIDELEIGLFVVKEDYTVQYMNNTMKRWFGDQTGHQCYSSVANSEEPCKYCRLQDVINNNEKVTYQPTTSDGKTFHIVAKSIINPDGTTSKMEIIRDITDELKAQEILLEEKKELSFKANHDFLTKLPNRALFEDRLERSIIKAKRNHTKTALLFLDLDNFKTINDSLGHDIGDIVLQETSKRINRLLREEDTLARLGGDEFTIILSDLHNALEVSIIAKKILTVLHEPLKIDDLELSISASIGMSLYPDDTSSSEELIKNADKAMYKVKERGRNSYKFYDKND